MVAGGLGGAIRGAIGLNEPFGSAFLFALHAALCSLGALWLAMWLQLDAPYWAASTVLITAQATRSQSLRKAVNRIVGTLIGIVASIVIVALFPQGWWTFALALCTWLALCTFVACLLRSQQAYAAALSGYTAVIVLTEAFGHPLDAFAIAVSRGSSVVLGVSLYMVTTVLVMPARGTAALHESFEAMFATARTLAAALLRGEDRARDCAALMARWSSLDEKIEEAATDGLWPWGRRAEMRRAALAMADLVVLSAQAAEAGGSAVWRREAAAALEDARGRRPVSEALARLDASRADLVEADAALPAATVAAMIELRAGLALLRTGVAPDALGRLGRTVHREYLNALYSALRAFLGLFAAFAFWILTRWPNGDSFAFVVGVLCCLFATRPSPIVAQQKFTVGTVITAIVALALGFYLVPRQDTFLGLAACLFAPMLIGAFGLKCSRLSAYCTPMNFFLLPMIGVRNQMDYDPSGFFNAVGAIVCGCCAGIAVFKLMPPFSTRIEARVLRWWIGCGARRSVPGGARRRAERRFRLYDRLGLLAAKLPPDEAATAFRTTRPLAAALCRTGSS